MINDVNNDVISSINEEVNNVDDFDQFNQIYIYSVNNNEITDENDKINNKYSIDISILNYYLRKEKLIRNHNIILTDKQYQSIGLKLLKLIELSKPSDNKAVEPVNLNKSIVNNNQLTRNDLTSLKSLYNKLFNNRKSN